MKVGELVKLLQKQDQEAEVSMFLPDATCEYCDSEASDVWHNEDIDSVSKDRDGTVLIWAVDPNSDDEEDE